MPQDFITIYHVLMFLLAAVHNFERSPYLLTPHGTASEEAKERAGEAKQYATLLREIHALMAEVQRQRTDFRNELRGLVNSLSRNRQRRPCLCSVEYKRPSRLPVMLVGAMNRSINELANLMRTSEYNYLKQ